MPQSAVIGQPAHSIVIGQLFPARIEKCRPPPSLHLALFVRFAVHYTNIKHCGITIMVILGASVFIVEMRNVPLLLIFGILTLQNFYMHKKLYNTLEDWDKVSHQQYFGSFKPAC